MTSPAPASGATHPWKALLKTGAVLAGYAAAFAVASAAVYVQQLHTQGPGEPAPDDMSALGEDFFFVQVFGGMGLFPTGLAFYFLRRVRAFWTVLGIAALAFAASGSFAATVIQLTSSLPSLPSFWIAWASLGVLRVLPSPLFAAAFLLGSCFAPSRFARWALLGATVNEGAVAAFGLFHWFIAPRLGAL